MSDEELRRILQEEIGVEVKPEWPITKLVSVLQSYAREVVD
jgi:hypothetical protein